MQGQPVAYGQAMPGQQPMMMQPGMQMQPGMVVMMQAPEVKEKKEKLKAAYKDGVWPAQAEKVQCHHCGEEGYSECSSEIGLMAWISCLVLCLLGCWMGCCLIPFCVSSCNDHKHKCTKCDKTLGKHKSI